MIVAAAALSLCLVACWSVARSRGSNFTLATEGDPLDGGRRSGARGEVVLATVLIAAGVALSAYFLDLPWRLDESSTVLVYASQSFGAVVTSYQTPGNHVLHSVLVWVAHQLGGWNRVVLRLPAFLSFCLLLPALWWFARREYGPTAAAFTAALAASTSYFVEFATNARGYTLLCLLFVAALLCGQSLVHRPERKTLWTTWAATIGLGFFTMPLMAFPAVATVCWMMLARWRRRGREGLGSFAVKIAGWSVVALAFAGVLYTPILVTIGGIDGMQTSFDGVAYHFSDATLREPLALFWHPVIVWFRWHLTSPAWFQGTLLGLALFGMAVRARTCRRAGTLVPAMVVATVAVFLLEPILFPPRMVIWALPLILVLAGAGAATAFMGLTARAEALWPGLGTPSARFAATFCAVLLALACSGQWAAQPDATRPFRAWNDYPTHVLPAMTSAVAEQVRAGDCITVDHKLRRYTVLHTRGLGHAGNLAGWYDPRLGDVARGAGWDNPSGRPEGRWPVYGTSAPAAGGMLDSACGEPVEGPGQSRLFALWPGAADKLWAGMTAWEFLETHGDSSELVADFGDGSVFVLDN